MSPVSVVVEPCAPLEARGPKHTLSIPLSGALLYEAPCSGCMQSMKACSEHAGPAGSTGGAFTSLGHAGSQHEKQATLQGISHEDLLCPICVELLQDAFVTTCGHTFCYACITTHLQHRSNCPSCASYLTADHIYPNFLLNKIISNASHMPTLQQGQPLVRAVQQVLASSRQTLGARDLDAAIKLLQAQRDAAVQREESCGLNLLLLLLQDASQRKQAARLELQQQLALLEKDLALAQKQLMPYMPLPASAGNASTHVHGFTAGAPTMPAGLQAAATPQYMMVGSTPRSLEQLQEQLQAAAAVAMQHGGVLHVHRLGPQHLSSISIEAQHLGGLDSSMLAAAMRSETAAAAAPASTAAEHMAAVRALEGEKEAAGDAAAVVTSDVAPEAKKIIVVPEASREPHASLSTSHTHAGQPGAGRHVVLAPTITQQQRHVTFQEQHHMSAQQQQQQHTVRAQRHTQAAQQQQDHQAGIVCKEEEGQLPEGASSPNHHQQQRQQEENTQAGAESDGAGSATTADVSGRQSPDKGVYGRHGHHGKEAGMPGHAGHIRFGTPTLDMVPVKVEPEGETAAASGATRMVVASSQAGGEAQFEQGLMQASLPAAPAAYTANGWAAVDGQHANGYAGLVSQQHRGNGRPLPDGHSKSVLGGRSAGVAFGDNPPASFAALRAAKRRLILSQYSNLEQCYFNLHQQGSSMPAVGGAGSSQEAAHTPAMAYTEQAGSQALASSGQSKSSKGQASADAPGIPLAGTADLLHQFVQVLTAATTYSCMTIQAEVPQAACGGLAFQTQRSAARTGSGSGALVAPGEAAGRGGGGGTSGRISSNHLVSCIDVDATSQLFATCSAQRLFLWQYNDVVSGRKPEEQAAAAQLHSRTKLTGVAFSRLQQQLLAACDSEGLVCLYDVSTLQLVSDIEAHDSRIWALDFAPTGAAGAPPSSQAHCFASGSDDYTVRVWDARDGRACSTIDTRANVCSVRYCPWDDNYLAVGSAAHAVLLYDLRKAGGTTAPLATLSGHSKAVSYVRWPSRYEIVSASTDSSLRLWDVRGAVAESDPKPYSMSGLDGDMHMGGDASTASCIQTYSGHVNERNFVGLAVSGDLIAAGSETNEVVVYYKPIPSPCVRHALSSATTERAPGHPAAAPAPARASVPGSRQPSSSGRPHNSSGGGQQHFISSVTWRHDPYTGQPTLLAANSQGSVYVLALQP